MKQQEVDHLVEALAFLICADRSTATSSEMDNYTPPIHRIPAAMFDGFEPIDDMSKGDDDFLLIGKNAADQPVWPVDCSVAHRYIVGPGEDPDDPEHWIKGTWVFTRMKTLVPKEWRGVLHQFYPRMIDEMQMYVRPNGKVESIRRPFAILPNGRVVNPARTTTGSGRGETSPTAAYALDVSWYGYRHSQPGGRYEEDLIAMIGGMMLRKRYMWSVLLGEGNGPRARLFTDVVGMRAIFRLRDIPPGRARRAALLHWVREHWRMRREPSTNDRAWVRAHIRGAWSYQWNGLLCQIVPSQSDMDLLTARAPP